MSTVKKALWTSVGRKILMAATGLGLFLFVLIHLLGNLTLLVGAEAFNGYAHFLEHLGHGAFIYVADAGLVLFFLAHAHSGLKVYLQKRKARSVGYQVEGDAGGASRKTLASKTMIVTGPIILIFVVLHVLHFKFGPGEEAGLTTVIHDVEMRDLYALVVHEFNRPAIAFGYMAVMLMLGLHLRHGFWSAFQSLGATSRKYMPLLSVLSVVFAVVLAVGFLYIPLHILAFVPDPGLSGAGATAQVVAGGLP